MKGEESFGCFIAAAKADPHRITLFGHSEDSMIVTRLAIENGPTKVKNIVLQGAPAHLFDVLDYQIVNLPIEYAQKEIYHECLLRKIPNVCNFE